MSFQHSNAPTSFVKGFAGVYGLLDPNGQLRAAKIDFHTIRTLRTTNNELHLIGTNEAPTPFQWPMPAQCVAVKGRPFWLTDPAPGESHGIDRLLTDLDGKFSFCAISTDGL